MVRKAHAYSPIWSVLKWFSTGSGRCLHRAHDVLQVRTR